LPDAERAGVAASPVPAPEIAPAVGLARRRWLLLLALLVTPVSMHGAEALFLLYLLAVAVATPWRALPRRRLVCLAAWTAVAALWLIRGTSGAAGWYHPLAAAQRHPVSLFDYLLMLFGFAVMVVDHYSVRDVKAILTTLVATVPIHFVFAVGQRYLGWGPFWRALPIGDGWLLELNLRIPELLAGRISAGLVHPNRLGAYSLLCCVAAAALLANEMRARPTSGAGPAQRARSDALAAIIVFCLVMLVWSGSRGAWLSAVVVSLPVAWLVGIRWRYVIGPIAATAVVVAAAALELGALTRAARRVVPVVVWGRLTSSPPAGLRVSAPDWRLSVYRCTWDLAAERPFTGWGVGGWVDVCEQRLARVINHAHNIFLQVAVESGWVAAVILMVSLAWVLGAPFGELRLLREPAARLLYGALVLMAVVVLLTNQTSMVLMQAARLEIVLAVALAVPYSLVFHRPVR
jgi:hypothetical protein